MLGVVQIPRALFAALGAVAVFGLIGCGGGGTTPPEDAGTDLCAGVTCESNQACNPENGKCEQRACDPACSGATPVCNPATVTCVTCTSTEGCSGETPICDTAANGGAGACVACTTDAQCGGATPLCSNNVCVTCTETSGCTGSTVCDTAANGGAGACVGCVGNGDCTGGTPVCNTGTKTCVACLSDAQCSGATPACDTATNTCVGCNSNGHCSGATPVCDTAAKSCVTCLSDANCSGATPVCDTSVAGGACVGCLGNDDCSGATPACNGATKTCVACVSDGQCGGATPACDTASNTCVTCLTEGHCPGSQQCDTSVAGGACVECLSDANCSGATPACDVATNTCVACVTDAQCGGATPACDVATNTCVACLSDAQCGGATPACDVAAKTCVSCLSDANCGGSTPACDVMTNTCVGCLSNANCGGATPTCNTATNSCVGCLTNSHCSSADPICNPATNSCVDCTSDAHCGGVTPACNVTTNSCVTCLSNAHCSGATPQCNTAVAGGACVACLNDGHCGTGERCESNACVTIPDTCATAAPIVFAAGQTVSTFPINATGTAHDYSGSCTNSTVRPEVVYHLNLTAAQDVRFDVQGSSGIDGVFFVRSSPCATGTQLACIDNTLSGAVETTTLLNLQPGDYYLFVESWGSTAFTGTATVTLLPPTLPAPGQNCQAPIPLTVSEGNPATFSLSTTTGPGVTNEHVGSCYTGGTGTTVGREFVYSVTLTQPQDMTVTAVGSGSVDPVLYVRNSPCATGTELSCRDVGGATEVLNLYNLQPGTYYVFVEQYDTAQGTINATVTLNPPSAVPTNDACGTAQTVSVTPGTPTTFSTNTALASDDTAGSCVSTTASREVVYEFTTTAAYDFNIVATGVAGVNPVLYLRSGNCGSGTQVACVNAASTTTETLNVLNQPAGTYYLFVETLGTASGTVDVTVNLNAPSLPPPNDTCAAPEVINFMGGNTATVTAVTNLATDATAGTCVTTAASREVVYQFELTQTENVVIAATGGTGANPALYVRYAGCTAGPQLACINASSTTGSSETLTLNNMSPGTYFLFVETVGSAVGSVNVTLTKSAATAGACASAIPLTVPSSITGTTIGASNSMTVLSGCGTASGNDRVYSFTTTAPGTFTAQVTPRTSGYRPVVSLRHGSACISGTTAITTVGCQTSPQIDHPAEVVVSNLPIGTWYLVVDGGSTAGDYDLVVDFDPLVPGLNDTCGTAEALTFSSQGWAQRVGTTVGMANDTSVSCASTASGVANDAIYRLDVPALQTGETALQAKVLLASLNVDEYMPAVSLRSTCTETGTTGQSFCSSNTSTTTPSYVASGFVSSTQTTAPLVPGGQHFIVVDGASSSVARPGHGPYRLDVLMGAVPHPYSTCATAGTLPTNATIAGHTLGATNDFTRAAGYYANAAGTNLTSQAFAGADVVYTWTAPANGPTTVRIHPDPTWDIGVLVMSACAPNSALAAADANGSGRPETVTFNAVQGTTYYVVADYFSSSTLSYSATTVGGFLLSVQQ